MLRDGLPEAGPGGGEPPEPVPRVAAAACRAVVAASGFLDADEYAVRHRLRRGTDPYRHHVETGWRLLQNPSPRFDLWSYWVDHLDPTTDGADPLLHWLVVGRHHGWAPVPAPPPERPRRPRPGTPPAGSACSRRTTRDGIVDDYVVTYLRELSRHADVYYLADGVLEPGELDKLADVTPGRVERPARRLRLRLLLDARARPGRLGRRRHLRRAAARQRLAASCCARSTRSSPTMDARACDWWSLQATSMEHDENYFRDDSPIPLAEAKRRFLGPRHFSDVRYLHLSSYFLVVPPPRPRPTRASGGASTPSCRRRPRASSCTSTRSGISRYLTDAGFDFDTWLPDLQPFHPLYSRHVFDLIGRGFPLAKRNFLGENPRRAPDVGRWRERLRELAPDGTGRGDGGQHRAGHRPGAACTTRTTSSRTPPPGAGPSATSRPGRPPVPADGPRDAVLRSLVGLRGRSVGPARPGRASRLRGGAATTRALHKVVLTRTASAARRRDRQQRDRRPDRHARGPGGGGAVRRDRGRRPARRGPAARPAAGPAPHRPRRRAPAAPGARAPTLGAIDVVAVASAHEAAARRVARPATSARTTCG